MTSLLRPFLYSFPVIPSMPFNRLGIFQSPFPMVIGLNMSKKDFKNLSDPTYVKKLHKDSSKFSYLVYKKKMNSQNFDPINVPDDFIKVFLDFKNFKFEYTEKIRTQFVSPKLKGWKKRIMIAYNKYRNKFGLDDDKVYGNTKQCKLPISQIS